MKKPKKIVAWVVSDKYGDGRGCVVFHHHALAARRIGATILGYEFELTVADREPKFDRYDGKQPPIEDLINAGWWWDCRDCGRRIDMDFREKYTIDEENRTVSCCHGGESK